MRRVNRSLPPILLAIVLTWFVWTGLQGIAFGPHWDEQSLVNRVRWSIEHGGTLLPGTYDWPSMAYWIALAALAPDFERPASYAPADIHRLEQHLLSRLDAPDYRLRLRRIFLLVTSLALVWLYLAARVWTDTPWAGVAAAGMLAGSWQFAYHARFPAPDGVLVQFVALIVLGAALTRAKPSSHVGPTLAALASGLAVGTKYTAWPIAVAWLASDAMFRARHIGSWRRATARGAFVMAGAFLVSTPGAILQPVQFVGSLLYVRGHYSDDASVLAPYWVGAGWPLVWASLLYLGAVLWSVWIPVTALVSAAVIRGAVGIARRDPSLFLVIAVGPMLMVAAMAVQPVLLVRNLLPVAAPLAFAGGVAVAHLATRFPKWSPAIAVMSGAAVVANLGYLEHAARTIGPSGRAAADAFHATDTRTSCVSERVGGLILATDGESGSPRVCTDRPRAVLPDELNEYPPPLWNRPQVFGPLDVDPLYYPTWIGSTHILVVK